MNDLTKVARTISEELERSVQSALKAQDAGLDLVHASIKTATEARDEGMRRVLDMQREAAELVAESMRERQRIEDQFSIEMDEALKRMVSLKANAEPAALRKPRKAQAAIEAPAGVN